MDAPAARGTAPAALAVETGVPRHPDQGRRDMDAVVIVIIVVAALVLLAVLALVARRGRAKRHETRRGEAGQIRREAEVHDARAEGARAEADTSGARVRREEAAAREQALPRARPRGRRAPSRRRGGPGRPARAARVDPPRRLNRAGVRGARAATLEGSGAAGKLNEHAGSSSFNAWPKSEVQAKAAEYATRSPVASRRAPKSVAQGAPWSSGSRAAAVARSSRPPGAGGRARTWA